MQFTRLSTLHGRMALRKDTALALTASQPPSGNEVTQAFGLFLVPLLHGLAIAVFIAWKI
ncbi:hypothetical protein [Nostoc sp.]|uniref:hypothetical protein n=1 Tax=Nostoc sp. TaxID=1180 RepID=UPI002FF54D39